MLRGARLVAVALGVALVVLPARAVSPEIQSAIDRGVAYLKKTQREDGTWPYAEHIIENPNRTAGATALAGLALLECGVPKNDPVIEKAATYIRKKSTETGFTQTYCLSLAIMFLDKLGDTADAQLIESMTLRLLSGQNANGGWTYECFPISAAEEARLKTLLTQRNELRAGTAPVKPGEKRDPKDLPPEIQAQLKQLNGGLQGPPGAPGGGVPGQGGQLPRFTPKTAGGAEGAIDHSNTQFAILALWIGRRQGIPVENALARVDAHFRQTQNAKDGGWGYSPFSANVNPKMMAMMQNNAYGSTPAMTCAGLLGLALGIGTSSELRTSINPPNPNAAPRVGVADPNKDPVIRNGLLKLGSDIGGEEVKDNTLPPQAQKFVPVQLGKGVGGKGYYLLWSLERVGVIYGLETIGNKKWYDWGSSLLLGAQAQDGSWRGDYAEGGVDTSFALLFLIRANVAEDLTNILKNRIQDPGKHELRGGTSVDDVLKEKGRTKPGSEGGTSTADSNPKEKPAAPKTSVKVDPDVARLGDELVNADNADQSKVIDKLRDTKGTMYTEALAYAISRLDGEARDKARQALAERLTRMSSATLKDKLQDEDAEIRRAAALAVGMKEDKTNVPRLIEMLKDPEATVGRAAHAALKSLSNQDFGPTADASKADLDKAIAAWQEWWSKQSK
jgi:hypothetical protein